MNEIKRIGVTMTEDQFEALSQKAFAYSMNLSEYLVLCGMNTLAGAEKLDSGSLKTFSKDMNYISRMWHDGCLSNEEYDHLQADLIEKYSKSACKDCCRVSKQKKNSDSKS